MKNLTQEALRRETSDISKTVLYKGLETLRYENNCSDCVSMVWEHSNMKITISTVCYTGLEAFGYEINCFDSFCLLRVYSMWI